ncbi:MAG: SRPBCC family protein [Caulobacteraceae bacterium]
MPYRIQQRVGVAAPASAVWKTVAALDSWSEWNPVYVEVEGRLSIGTLWTLKRVTASKVVIEQAKVVDWVPNEQLVWARSISLMATAISYIEIEALTETGCILAVGEIYSGLVGERIGHFRRRSLNAGFRALSEAIKTRAEAEWDGVPDAPRPPPAPKPKPVVKTKQASMSMLRRSK